MKKRYFILLLILVLLSGCTSIATFPDDWIDTKSNSLTIIEETHHQIHLGNHYRYEDYYIIPTGGEYLLLINTTSKEFHLNYYFSFEYGEGEFILYYNPVINLSGTEISFINSNLNNFTTVSTVKLYSSPSVVSYGKVLGRIRLGDRRESMRISREDNEIVIPKNSLLLLRFINYNTGSNIVNVRLIGYA